MFSQHKSESHESLPHFFERLNTPLQKMPAQDRAELHTELRQHLDALMAAHRKLGATEKESLQFAIKQFGDPSKIGRQLLQEWQRKHKPRADLLRLSLISASGLVSWLLVLKACAYSTLPIPEYWLLVVPPIAFGLIWGGIGPRQLRHSLLSANLILFLSLLLFAVPFILFLPHWELISFYQIPICCWFPLTSLAVYMSSRCRTFSFKVGGNPHVQTT